MAVALEVSNPAEFAAFESGYVLGAWGVWLFLVLGSAICGLAFGVVELTTYKDLALTLPWSPLATSIRRIISGLVHVIVVWSANPSLIALYVEVQDTQDLDRYGTLQSLTPDLWPIGASPRLIYEPA